MTTEDKKLLLKDYGSRIGSNVKLSIENMYGVYGLNLVGDKIITVVHLDSNKLCYIPIEEVKPFLRPLSSMTEEERKEYQYITERWMYDTEYSIADSIDWLNSHHFDYRGLIEKGLALEAPEGMYNEFQRHDL